MHRTCEDCMWNNSDENCSLGHNRIFENDYDYNRCEDGTGSIYFDAGDDEDDDDE